MKLLTWSVAIVFNCLFLPVALAQPDNFANRQVLAGSFVQASNNNQTATREVGEPTDTGYRSLWYSWTAPDTGEITISLDGGDIFNKTLDVWMGNTVSGLKWVAGANSGSAPATTFPVAKGTTYAISMGSYFSSEYGNIVVSLTLDTSSPINTLNLIGTGTTTNDLFASRILSSTEFGSYLVYNESSGRDTLEPTPGYKTMWWTYHAPKTGRLTVTTDGSWIFTKWLSVWSGSLIQNLVQLVPNESDGAFSFPVIQGNDYQICIGSYYSSEGGPIVLTFLLDSNSDLNSFNLSGGAAIGNDSFANAKVLAGTSPAAVTYCTYATREALEPANNGYRTLWFKWTADVAGNTQILTQGSDTFTKLITVYTGTAINNLTQVVQSAAANLATASFSAVAGQTYYVSVGSYYSNDSGSIVFSWFGQPGTPTTGPALTIERAVRLKFQSESGRAYRIQTSSDLSTWNSLTNVITGNGAIKEVFVGEDGANQKSFRVFVQ